MNPTFSARNVRQQRSHFPRLKPGIGAARPLILVPTFRRSAFKLLVDGRVDFLNFSECSSHSVACSRGRKLPRVWASCVALQNATRALLIDGAFIDAHYRQISG